MKTPNEAATTSPCNCTALPAVTRRASQIYIRTDARRIDRIEDSELVHRRLPIVSAPPTGSNVAKPHPDEFCCLIVAGKVPPALMILLSCELIFSVAFVV